MDNTQEPLANDNGSHVCYQPNFWDLSCRDREWFGSVGLLPYNYSQDAGGPLVTGAQDFFTSPIPGPFATHTENSPLPPEEYRGAANRPLTLVPDPPTWPTLQRPIDMARESSNTFRPPDIPELKYSPMEHRGLYIDNLGPFSVESAQRAVGSGTHPGSGGFSNGPDSEELPGFSEANTIEPSKGIWVPFVRPPAGQATSCQPSAGIGARAEIHPPAHVHGRSGYGLYCIGDREEEVAHGNGEMNRAEQSTMSSVVDWPDQRFETTPSLNRNAHTSTARAPIKAGIRTGHGNRGVSHTAASLPSSSSHPPTLPIPVSPRAVGPIRTARTNHRASHRYERSVFDRPGKKAAAEYEPDPNELRERCRQQGGKDFAIAWLGEIFVDGVTVGALVRPLTMLEVDTMTLRHPGFKPAQGYDGFLERPNKRFSCGLCPDEKRMHWENKKDAVRHLRKFHFGLADRCIDW